MTYFPFCLTGVNVITLLLTLIVKQFNIQKWEKKLAYRMIWSEQGFY